MVHKCISKFHQASTETIPGFHNESCDKILPNMRLKSHLFFSLMFSYICRLLHIYYPCPPLPIALILSSKNSTYRGISHLLSWCPYMFGSFSDVPYSSHTFWLRRFRLSRFQIFTNPSKRLNVSSNRPDYVSAPDICRESRS